MLFVTWTIESVDQVHPPPGQQFESYAVSNFQIIQFRIINVEDNGFYFNYRDYMLRAIILLMTISRHSLVNNELFFQRIIKRYCGRVVMIVLKE